MAYGAPRGEEEEGLPPTSARVPEVGSSVRIVLLLLLFSCGGSERYVRALCGASSTRYVSMRGLTGSRRVPPT
eukprot:5993872-Prymnesium_polylepis.1